MSSFIKIMGCGNSMGVPTACGSWGKCDPNEKRNERTRASILIRHNGCNIVMDTGPDFRQQAIKNNLERIDAVIYSHYHGDHCHGIDDLRPFFNKQQSQIPVFCNEETNSDLKDRFPYCFKESLDGFYKTVINVNIWDKKEFGNVQTVCGLDIIPFEQDHLSCNSIGIRIGDIAYSTDFVRIDKINLEYLRGAKTWIADGAGYWDDKLFVHATIKQLIRYKELLDIERVIVTDLSTRMDYNTLIKDLPKGFEPAYDGMKINI